jgi:hypothetical protein
MLYDYRQESKTPMLLTLANGKTIEGEFIDLRIDTNTLPKGKLWYHIRHTDDDWTEPASLKWSISAVRSFATPSTISLVDRNWR